MKGKYLKRLNILLSQFLIAILLLTFVFNLYIPRTQAAALTNLSDTLSRLKVSTASNHDIRFRFPTGMSSGSIVVNFNAAGFSSGTADYTDVDLWFDSSSTDVDNGNCYRALIVGANPGQDSWGASFSSNSLTLAYPDYGGSPISANDYVRIKIGTNATDDYTGDRQITNPNTPGSNTISITAGVDTGKIGVVIVDDDQVGVTATVDPTLTFSISDTSVGFGSFVGTNIRYATGDLTGSATVPGDDLPVQLTAATNGILGWSVTVRSQGNGVAPGLYSSALDELITVQIPGDIGYGYTAYAKNADVGVSIDEQFNGSGADDTPIDINPQVFATTSAPSGNLSFDLVFMAAVESTTKAGNYSDTVTVICTANY